MELHPRASRSTPMAYLSPLHDDSLPGLDRRSGLSHKELLNEYVIPQRPVILVDAVKRWPALGKWTPEFFSRNYGSIKKEVKGKEYTIAQQMELIKTSTEENPAPYSYNLNIDHYFPELLGDLEPQILFGKSDRLVHPLTRRITRGTIKHEVFFGGKGSCFPNLHVDVQSLHTQITQLYGDKEFFLYAPDQSPYMYPKKENYRMSSVDIFKPDLAKYPLFAKAKAHRAMLREGETVFFPTGWWHTTHIPGPSISYGRAILNDSNWDAYLKETYDGWKATHPAMALPALVLGKVLGGVLSTMEGMRS